MTAVVALRHNNTVYIGGDSAAVSDLNIITRVAPKVFHKGDLLIGYTTSFRMGQLIQHRLIVPKHGPKVDLMEYMVTTFVDSVRESLKEGGFSKKQDEVEEGGTFIVVKEGRLFVVDSDYQVAETQDEFVAIGSGNAYALGAFYTSRGKNPRLRVMLALEAAQHFSAGVREPFTVLTRRYK